MSDGKAKFTWRLKAEVDAEPEIPIICECWKCVVHRVAVKPWKLGIEMRLLYTKLGN